MSTTEMQSPIFSKHRIFAAARMHPVIQRFEDNCHEQPMSASSQEHLLNAYPRASSNDFAARSVSVSHLNEENHAESFDSDVGLFRNAHTVK